MEKIVNFTEFSNKKKAAIYLKNLDVIIAHMDASYRALVKFEGYPAVKEILNTINIQYLVLASQQITIKNYINKNKDNVNAQSTKI